MVGLEDYPPWSRTRENWTPEFFQIGLLLIAGAHAGRIGAPNGIRTRVATLKEWSPRPLDDGDPAGQSTKRRRR